MVRSALVLAVLGVACLAACDPRPLRYPGAGALDGAAVQIDSGAGGSFDDGGTGVAADAGAIATPPVLVSVGDNFSCALRGDSTAACWGFNGNGQATPPPDKLTSISAGGRFACGLRADGSIACWGANDRNQAMPPAGTGFIRISAGDTHACALTSGGETRCWGTTSSTTTQTGSLVDLVSGAGFTCALQSTYGLTCWGRLAPSTDIFPTPTPTFTQISARGRMFCSLDRTVWCWGLQARQPLD